MGSRGFYFRAHHGLLPPRASDMLAARIGQLTAWGLSPHKIRGLADRSPDIISAILAEVIGPLHRNVPLVQLLVSSQETTASPQTS